MTKDECKEYLKKGFFENNPRMWVSIWIVQIIITSYFFNNFEYGKVCGLVMSIALYSFIWHMRTNEDFIEVAQYLKKLEEQEAKLVRFSSEEKE